MQSKHEDIKDKDMFYCFVALGENESQVFVVPASKVASVVKESHAKWLNTPGAKGQRRNDTEMRRIRNNYKMNLKSAPDGWMERYLEDWLQITS